jgi:hypothetical protein
MSRWFGLMLLLASLGIYLAGTTDAPAPDELPGTLDGNPDPPTPPPVPVPTPELPSAHH